MGKHETGYARVERDLYPYAPETDGAANLKPDNLDLHDLANVVEFAARRESECATAVPTAPDDGT